MGKSTAKQEAAMDAAMTIGERLDNQLAGLKAEDLRQEGYRAGLLKGAQILEGYAAKIDKLYEDQSKKTGEEAVLTNEDRILIRKHLNMNMGLLMAQRKVSEDNKPVLQGKMEGVMQAMRLVATYHTQQGAEAEARKAAPAPKEKRVRAQETADRRSKRRANKLKLDNQEVAVPLPQAAKPPEESAEPVSEPTLCSHGDSDDWVRVADNSGQPTDQEACGLCGELRDNPLPPPDNVVQMPTPVAVSDRDVNRYVRKRKLAVLRSEAEFLGLSSKGGRRELARRILEHREKAG